MGIQRKNIKMYKKLITILIIGIAINSIATIGRDLGDAPKKMAKAAPVKEVGKGSAKPAPQPVLKKAADVKVKPVGGKGSLPPKKAPKLKPVKAAPVKKVGGKGSLPPVKKPKAKRPKKRHVRRRRHHGKRKGGWFGHFHKFARHHFKRLHKHFKRISKNWRKKHAKAMAKLKKLRAAHKKLKAKLAAAKAKAKSGSKKAKAEVKKVKKELKEKAKKAAKVLPKKIVKKAVAKKAAPKKAAPKKADAKKSARALGDRQKHQMKIMANNKNIKNPVTRTQANEKVYKAAAAAGHDLKKAPKKRRLWHSKAMQDKEKKDAAAKKSKDQAAQIAKDYKARRLYKKAIKTWKGKADKKVAAKMAARKAHE